MARGEYGWRQWPRERLLPRQNQPRSHCSKKRTGSRIGQIDGRLASRAVRKMNAMICGPSGGLVGTTKPSSVPLFRDSLSLLYDFLRPKRLFSTSGGRNTLLAIDKVSAPTIEHPWSPAEEGAHQKLNVSVVFTSVKSTLGALKEAGRLASNLRVNIVLVVPQTVPYPLPVEAPPVTVEYSEKRFRVIASESQVETSVQIYLCRDRFKALTSVLRPGAIVVLGGRKRWWPTKDEILARKLSRAGYEVVFKKMQ